MIVYCTVEECRHNKELLVKIQDGGELDTSWIQPVSNLYTEVRLGEDSQVKDKIERADKPPTRPRFSPPSVEDVAEYVREKGYHVDAFAFVNHYEATGWKIGKNSMKNWRAAVNTWENREKRWTMWMCLACRN